MQDLKWYMICLSVSYLCGCFLTADAVAHVLTGKSASQIGTGNPGMANIMANVGKKAGALVLMGDVLKTVLAMGLSWWICGDIIGRSALLWAGIGVILGHNYPFWKKFRGGKGVAVTCTWLMILMPLWGTLSCILGGLITLWTGFLPLGAICIPLFALVFALPLEGIATACFVAAAFLLMLAKHYRGLMRILRGEEERKFRRQ